MKKVRYFAVVCLLFATCPLLFSAEPIDKMSLIDLFENALDQMQTYRNYQRRIKLIAPRGRQYGEYTIKLPKCPDLYASYITYRDEIVKRGPAAKYLLQNWLNIKGDIEVTVLAIVMLDRINNPEKYKRLDTIRKKMLDDAQPLAVSPMRNLTRQAHALLSGLYDKNPYESSDMDGMGAFAKPKSPPHAKTKGKDYPAKQFTKNTSIEFLCEMALTNQGAFRAYSLILLGQFKDSKLATKILHDAFGDINEEIRRAALDGIALSGDLVTVRKALKDDSNYIRKAAAKLLRQEKNKK